MFDFFIILLFGHLIGDYFLQSLWMALNKKKGFDPLFLHCITYTGVVVFSTLPFFIIPVNIPLSSFLITVWILIVFVSHVLLDGTNIVNKWLHTIESRSYERTQKMLEDENLTDVEKMYAVAYTAIVQTVVDNTAHLAFMYLGYYALKCSFYL
jgi:hypothetical protein